MPLKRIELAILAVISISVGILLAKFAPGGPLSSDVIWYINSGLNGIADPFNLNRYFHIFLQAIFARAAPTPLSGVQAFWAFQVAITCFLVYVNTRLFSPKTTPIHSALAVAILLSFPTFAEWTGVPFVDLTLMMVIMLLVLVYLLWLNRPDRPAWLLLLLGALAYISIRTKETAIWSFVLLLGIGFTREDRFEGKAFLRNLGRLALGILAGIIFMALLNWILVKDPFWGWRPAEWRDYWFAYIQSNSEVPIQTGSDNWYSGYLSRSLLVPFLLYVVSGIKQLPETGRSQRLLWLVPLAGILFLVATQNNRHGFQDRFFLPAFPVVSMLAVQFLDLEVPSTRKDWGKLVLLLGGGIGLAVLLRFGLRAPVYRSGLDFGQWLDILFQPVLLTVLLAALFLSRRTTSWTLLAVTFSLTGLLLSPLLANARTMFVERPIQALTRFDYYPFSAFEAEIAYTPGMKLLVSPAVPQLVERRGEQGASMLATDSNELVGMFNIYYDARATGENIFLLPTEAALEETILSGDYTYVLLAETDWEAISSDPALRSAVEQRYRVFTEERGLILLLEAR